MNFAKISESTIFYWTPPTAASKLKVGLSPSKKNCVICFIEIPLKMMKNGYYFILKALFVLEIFKFLSRRFGQVGKMAKIRNVRLTSKFMTSQLGLQTIAIHILPNISQSKGNQAMKFGQLIEYNKRNIFLQKLCKKWCQETSSRPLSIFKKSLTWGESKWPAVKFQYISIAVNLSYNKNKLYKILDYWSRDMPNFGFSEKGLGLLSPPHFVHDFSRKMFLMLHSINWPNFIV